jgi:hypothetical protein
MLWKRLEGNLAFEGGIFGKVDFPMPPSPNFSAIR